MIDAHVHFWDRSRFRYDWLDDEPCMPDRFLPADFDEAAPGVDSVVLVQADCSPSAGLDEARWFNEIGAARVGVAGVVAFAPLELPDVGDHLDALSDITSVVGVRRLLQSEPSDFFDSPELDRGLRQLAERELVFDACVRWRQLPALVGLVSRHEGVTFVLDHLGKPPVAAGFGTEAGRAWADSLGTLAQLANVVVKLSGLPAETVASQRELAFRPYQPWLARALEAFGPERAIFGSDWPVSAVAGLTHGEWRAEVEAVAGAGEARAAVFGETAARVYRLGGIGARSAQ